MTELTTAQLRTLFNLQRTYNFHHLGKDWQTQTGKFAISVAHNLGQALSYIQEEWGWELQGVDFEKKTGYMLQEEEAWVKVLTAFGHNISKNNQVELDVVVKSINDWYSLAITGSRQSGFEPTEKKPDALLDTLSQSTSDAGPYKEYACFGVLCAAFGKTPEDLYYGGLAVHAYNLVKQEKGLHTLAPWLIVCALNIGKADLTDYKNLILSEVGYDHA